MAKRHEKIPLQGQGASCSQHRPGANAYNDVVSPFVFASLSESAYVGPTGTRVGYSGWRPEARNEIKMIPDLDVILVIVYYTTMKSTRYCTTGSAKVFREQLDV